MQTARVLWVEGEQFLATMPSGHAITFDCDRERNSGPGPMEMLLGALGTCTAYDVAEILKKKRQKLVGLEVMVHGERAAKPPAVWAKIEMVYRLKGDLNEKAVRDAIELSQSKYCSVAAMLGQVASITYRYEIAG
ncbi:MAG TPA: OsmC family protein [Candidatus Dormibacteraeota bacterium]|nr:OsmC family protein [Candidatus Dormibacteraeota bacterium]